MTMADTGSWNAAATEGPTLAQERDHLAEQCATLLQENRTLRAALERIIAIEDSYTGSNWDEIAEARGIARAALTHESR
jgi:hypothetical protein